MNTREHNPYGLATNRPIALRLMPNELHEAKRIAAQANISESCLARRAFLAGVEQVARELNVQSTAGESAAIGVSES